MNSFNERKQKAFDFASDSAKQLITISIAIITVTISFAKDIFKTETNAASQFLIYSWILYLFTAFSGIWALLALTGELENDNPSVKKSNVKIPYYLQIVSFLLGTITAIIFGIMSITTPITPTPPTQSPKLPITPTPSVRR